MVFPLSEYQPESQPLSEGYTVLITVWRKPGMSMADFHHHYETSHMPLIRDIAHECMPLSHTRLYVHRAGPNLREVMVQESVCGDGIDYDAVAELVFRDKAHSDSYWKVLYEEKAQRLPADEEMFMDRSKLRIVEMSKRNLMYSKDFGY